MKSLSIPVGLMVLAFSVPAQAWKDLSDDSECRMGITWELGTTLLISKSKAPDGDRISGDLMSDEVMIFMANDDWASLKPEQGKSPYADFLIRFEDEHGNWLEGKPFVGQQSFLLTAELDWLKNFENSSSMLVTKDGKKIGQFAWSGFFYPFAKFKRCINSARAPIVERRRQEQLRKDTPVDPFAE